LEKKADLSYWIGTLNIVNDINADISLQIYKYGDGLHAVCHVLKTRHNDYVKPLYDVNKFQGFRELKEALIIDDNEGLFNV